ncbi:hypothetical protein HZA87_05255 [Candidatus Uhrbacteria bacterium]|nr:hypothetical protein [Candidatus Uhrbacteria bacterium]
MGTGEVAPCTFGGLPFFCEQFQDGSITLRQMSGTSALFIDSRDMARAAPHLVILK